jgi:hypothetical protein
MDKQTKDQIIAEQRAADAARNSAVWNALKRTPGLLAGGTVDAINAVLGTVTGKGFLAPLVKNPIGGGESINEAFGMPASEDPFQQGVEAVTSMLNPAGAAKAIIIAAVPRVTKTLGVEKVIDRAQDMTKAGESAWRVGKESEKTLREMRNPGGALSVFIGPEGIPRIKIDPAVASISKSSGITTTPVWYGTRSAATLPKEMIAGQNDLLGPERLLSDILYHPSLYDISPTARTATVAHSSLMDLFGQAGGYSYNNNMITLPEKSLGPARIKNDPVGYLLETLLHESTHLLQKENQVRGGGAPKIDSVVRSLTEAQTSGSFRTPEELDKLRKYAEALRKMPDSDRKDALIENLYMSNYGEWEARQGSQYGRSLPMMNERGAIY